MILFGLLWVVEMLPFNNEISKTSFIFQVLVLSTSVVNCEFWCACCEFFCFKIQGLGESCFLTLNIGLSAIIIVEGTFGKIQAFSYYDDKYYCFFFLPPSLSPSLSLSVLIICIAKWKESLWAALFSEGFMAKCNKRGRTAMTDFSFLSPVSAGSRLTAVCVA